jgi:cellulose synthase/poly-beta-1,6-N-acetylglucosamine synthase-like glycosyltransferase
MMMAFQTPLRQGGTNLMIPPGHLVVTVAVVLVWSALLLLLYVYLAYPAILWLLGRFRNRTLRRGGERTDWPRISITVPAYNEEAQIEELIKSLLALDYAADRVQRLIVSDASSDRTDEIVRGYADQGIELLRMSKRGGKTRAENAAAEHLTGDIIVNTDASIRIAPDALKALVAAFADPSVGLASGRDVSVGAGKQTANVGESGYVGYEMAVRDLETRVGGIIGASGCFYAIRPELHRLPLPEALSRDFAAALHTIEHGFRAVSVPEAICFVPRTTSLRKEFRRKVRTITRGMETLWHKRRLLNPLRTGVFAWMLFSHKILRWALPWAALVAYLALGVLAPVSRIALALFATGTVALLLAVVGWALAERARVPRVFSIPAFVVAGNLAAMVGLLRAISGDEDPTWEPTRRDPTPAA